MEPKRSKEVYDRISELPDGIIEDIMSRLTLSEAARTSVLSRRWENMWTCTTGSFNFDFGSKVLNLMKQRRYCYVETARCNIREEKKDYNVSDIVRTESDIYVNRVNKILKAHKGSSVEDFKVKFCLESSYKSDIDSWIEFAVRKGVKRLKLKLEPFEMLPLNVQGFYQLSAVKMVSLKRLNLTHVNVSDEVLEYLLMPENCPSLEVVSIMFSESLVNVRVVAPCLKLKHLKIQICDNLKCLDIYSAPNLTSFLIWGHEETRICLREVPNLTDVTLVGDFCKAAVDENFNQLSIPFSRIEKLNLCFKLTTLPQIHEFPFLKNLKQLELKSPAFKNQNVLLSCSSMIKACPNLNKFCISLNWLQFRDDDRQVHHCQDRSIHKNLKVVEFGWFCGKTCDVELATYLLSTSPYLDKIVADTRSRCPRGTPRASPNNKCAKDCLTNLARRLSPTAQLVLL